MSFFTKVEKLVVKKVNRILGRNIEYFLDQVVDPLSIEGVFDNRYLEVSGVVSTFPVVRIDLADLPSFPSVKDKVEIESETYRILEVREDGFGGASLILQKD